MKKVIFATLWIRRWTWHLFLLLGPEVTGDIFALSLGQQLLWDSGGSWFSWLSLLLQRKLMYSHEGTYCLSFNLLPSQFVWGVSSQKSSVPLSWWYHDPGSSSFTGTSPLLCPPLCVPSPKLAPGSWWAFKESACGMKVGTDLIF